MNNDEYANMAKKSKSSQSPKVKVRGTLSVVLSREDNDFFRDYRYTQIMTTHNTELSLVDTIDQFFDIFREEYDKVSSMDFNDKEKSRVAKEIRTSLNIRTKDLDLLKKHKLDCVLRTSNIEFTLTQALQHVFDVVRQRVKREGYELLHRPEIVREAEINNRYTNKRIRNLE